MIEGILGPVKEDKEQKKITEVAENKINLQIPMYDDMTKDDDSLKDFKVRMGKIAKEVSKKQNNMEREEKYIDFLENKLNIDIGWYYWKKYIAAAFWSQVSMPINLTITLITAVTTAQASAPDLISTNVYKDLTYLSLFLTVINTFFRPYEKLQKNMEYMKKWYELGITFEKTYYSSKNNNYDIEKRSTQGSIEQSTNEYIVLQEQVNELRKKEGPEMINFLTDFIHLICFYTFLKNSHKWLDRDKNRNSLEIKEEEGSDNV
jgi:hypothetical protein